MYMTDYFLITHNLHITIFIQLTGLIMPSITSGLKIQINETQLFPCSFYIINIIIALPYFIYRK